MACKSCDLELHFKCAGLSVNDYQYIHSDSNPAWECSVCLSSTNFGTSSFPNVEIKRGLKIAHININRLYNKLDNVRDLLQFYLFDILAITETWLTSNVIDSEIHIDGYSFCRKDRTSPTKKSGVGCSIYVRNNLVYNEKDIASDDSECIWIEVKRQHCKSLFICCVYRPEEQDVSSSFIVNLEQALTKLENSERSDICILGDFNIDYAKRKNSSRRYMENFASKVGLNQMIKEFTRMTETSQTMIDLLYFNNIHRIRQHGVIHLGLSDHFLIYCVIKCGIPKAPPRVIDYRSFKSFDQNKFISDLNHIPWSIIDNFDDIDDAIFAWSNLFSSVANEHAPIKRRKVKGTPCPWAMFETLDYTILIGSTPTFLYFDLYLYSSYAAHFVYFTLSLDD